MSVDIPLISIVTPSFNQGDFIEETITSVVNQDYDRIEYVVIDGQSSDQTVDVIKKYESKINFWVSEPDGGQTEAINKGLAKISGDIWGYLCSDDTYEPNVLRKVAEFFKENPEIDVVYGSCNWINENGALLRKKTPRKKFSRKDLLKDNFLYQPSMFLRRRVLEKYGYFREDLDFGMDYEYWLRVSKEPFAFIDLNISNYRLHFNSKSIKQVKKMRKEMIKIKEDYGYGWHARLAYVHFLILGFPYYRFKQFVYKILVRLKAS